MATIAHVTRLGGGAKGKAEFPAHEVLQAFRAFALDTKYAHTRASDLKRLAQTVGIRNDHGPLQAGHDAPAYSGNRQGRCRTEANWSTTGTAGAM